MINLQPINQDNGYDILRLKADPTYVAANVDSMAEAYLYHMSKGHFPLVWGIYNDATPVGFAMVDYCEQSAGDTIDNQFQNYYYLWRFMIDENHQRKGYGLDAIKLIIEQVKTMPMGESNALYTSVDPRAGNPIPFYEKLGFEKTGEVYPPEDDSEEVMRLVF